MELDYKKKHSSFYGEIPKDWDVKLLPEVFDYIHGKAHEQHIDSSGAFTVVNSKFISSEGKVSKQSSNNFCPAKKGDILTVLSDLPNGKALAKTYYVNVNMKYAVNQRICIWRSKRDYPLFLSYIMNRHKYFMKFDDGVTQTHILNHHIEKCPVLVPRDINEQKSIATTLSDIDELITGLEKLISKKKVIKQGAMQQLLTPPHKGGKRLPGFEGEWVERPFTDMIWFQEGPGLRKWQFTSKGIKVINITNLVNGYLDLEKTQRHISWDEFNKMYKHFEVDEGDIVVASSGNSYCKTSVVRNQDLPLVMNTSVIRFKPLKNLNYNLLLILLKSDLFKDQIDLLITGGAQPNFGPVHLPKVFFTLPESMEEQNAIGQILSDMDAEITQLESKKEKYQAIKQGMMQELLTGKTRLA